MVELLQDPNRIELAHLYFKSSPMADQLVELYQNDPELHEELFCDHWGYTYGFHWMKRSGEFLGIDLGYFPAIMIMGIQNLHFLQHIRSTINFAIAGCEGRDVQLLQG